jgi:TolB-like protein/tRNA A-37 threonylcarbamoyl transferase component Bud32/Tfp pilus assembly protein PilF
MLGNTLSHYQIIERLGAGGMGEVYLAKDTILGRNAAIKLLRPETLADPLGKLRFLREARAVAALNHPNIAVLYEAGGSDEAPFLAMEFVAGKTLKEIVANGPLAADKIVDYATQIASGLEHAHAQGILHRDIKAANILVTPQSTIKLLDFGLAKIAEQGEETRSLATAQGSWVGTLHYCPPEILSGSEATVRSDLYSLGVVIYEMACGKLPFAGLDSAALVNAITRGSAPSPLKKNAAIPPALSAVIERAMAARPDDRFRTAGELRSALQASLHAGAKGRSVGQQTLVVMQFQNISGDSTVDWLGTGIAETLRTDLKKLEFLRVVSRERVHSVMSSASLAGANGIAIAKELDADLLVDGSYQRAGDRLRMTPRLLEVETGEVLDTHKLDGNWEDVFALQDRVVSGLTASLQVRLNTESLKVVASPETRHLKAYEHYAQARTLFYQFGKDSLEQARAEFEAALALDALYAAAHSGLGRTYAMRFIHRTDPDDLSRARGHLERAIELDPELGEPYAWLSYAFMRQGKLQQALEAGQKSVQLEPDVFFGHYFLATVHTVLSEHHPESSQHAARAALEAARLDPRFEFTWSVLGEIALLVGNYGAAEEFLDRALSLGKEPVNPGRFVGSGVLRATIALRRGQYDQALQGYQDAIEFISARDHMYREAYLALGACGLGDVNLRANSSAAALLDYQRALRITKEFPRMLGLQRVQARTLAGLAAACAIQGDTPRAKQYLDAAVEKTAELFHQPQTWIWHGGLPHLYYGIAGARSAMGEPTLALEALEDAARAGWRDVLFLESDPLISSLRTHHEFSAICERLHRIPKLDFSMKGSTSASNAIAL